MEKQWGFVVEMLLIWRFCFFLNAWDLRLIHFIDASLRGRGENQEMKAGFLEIQCRLGD